MEAAPAAGPDNMYACPYCGAAIGVAAADLVVDCPTCGGQFFRPAPADDLDPDAPPDPPAADREAELDATRIRQISTLRRGLYRTRGHLLVAAAILLVSAGQLLLLAVRHVLAGDMRLKAVGYGFAAAAGGIGCRLLLRRVAAVNRELRDAVQHDPETPPDLSTLSDGRHRWQNLERMHGTEGPS